MGSGELDQQLRALTNLKENLDWFAHTHMVANSSL